jgi:hypothetical protein
MQRLAAVRVRDDKRVGNWSGTGAGKTLSAVLASRVADAGLTIITCPNSVVDGWAASIREIFPDSVVATKTLEPTWASTGFGDESAHRYLVLNYEQFQQAESANRVASLVENEQIDFIVIDEIHHAKQRQAENMSRRRELVSALVAASAERNPDLRVLGMSATPVINNLREGRSLVELVTGLVHEELATKPTVPNCMSMHQALVRLGIRWRPEYAQTEAIEKVEVDCGEFVDEIRELGKSSTPLALEQILTRARLPVILDKIKPKTLIYTHYVRGIDRLLRDAVRDAGWSVGFYTGDEKSGLDRFINGDLDVLIASSAVATGVDGLQRVCDRLIVNVLPWTAAEFEQLRGRIHRQGQQSDKVTVVVPLTYADVDGERWSWCESKMKRLDFKKSIADAAVDGVVPEGHLRTPAQAYQDVMSWLERLEDGELVEIARPPVVVPLPDADEAEVAGRRQRYGDFSRMNQRWNGRRSDNTHTALVENPEEWEEYHTLYRKQREDWAVVPYEELIRWLGEREGYTVGDFGCGEALIAQAASERHTVHSFDHVAIKENVVATDMAHVPLDDETLDVAIFSLSLMGSNFADYLREAHRVLRLDGQLHIYEATSRFTDREQFARDVEALGFRTTSVEDAWKFTHIHALKTERDPKNDVRMSF